MKTEKVKKILLGRIDKLTDTEKEWVLEKNRHWYNTYLFEYADQNYSDNMWNSFLASFFLWPTLSSQPIISKEVSIFGEENESCYGYDG